MTLTTLSYLTLRSALITTALAPAGRPAWACVTAATSASSGRRDVFLSIFTSSASSLPMITWITWSGARDALATLGRSIMLGAISGAVTMKMINSTSITSMNGTMLISLMVRRRPPCLETTTGMASVPGRRLGAQVAVQNIGELLDEGLQLDGHPVDVPGEPVVRDHRGNRGEQADRGGDQRFGDAGRHGSQGHRLQAGQAGEGMHDAPHRAEQADIGRNRTDRGQERKVCFDRVQLALVTGPHGAPCAVQQRARVGDAALAQLLVLAHAAGEDALHRSGQLGVLSGGGEQVVQGDAGPEVALEIIVERVHALQGEQLAEDRGPTGDRHSHQQQHDKLHHPAGIEHQLEDRQVWFHRFNASRMVGGILAGFSRAASTQPIRMVPSHSKAPVQKACWAITKDARPSCSTPAVTRSSSSSRAAR